MAIGSTARKPVGNQTAYLRKRLFGDGSAIPPIGGNGTYTIGFLPAGANILRISTLVRVVFSGGTPTISFGTNTNLPTSGAAFFAAAGAPITTLGRNNITLLGVAALGMPYTLGSASVAEVANAIGIVAIIAGTPTAGVADVEVEYTIMDEADIRAGVGG